MMRQLLALGFAAGMVVLGGCNEVRESTGPSISAATLAGMSTAQLESEYARFGQRGRSLSAAQQEQAAAIGRELAGRRVNEYIAEMGDARVDGEVPLAKLNEMQRRGRSLAELHPPTAEQFLAQLSQQRQQTLSTMGALRKQASEAMAGSPLTAMKIRQQVLELSEGSAVDLAAYRQFVDELAEEHFQRAQQAQTREDWSQAKASLTIVQQVKPEYPGVDEGLRQAEARWFGQVIRTAIAEGDYELARSKYAEARAMPDSQQVLAGVQESALVLVDYLEALAGDQAAAANFLQAKDLLVEANAIRADFGEAGKRSRKQSAFADKLLSLAKRALRKQQHGTALGLLFLVGELDPQFPRLATTQRDVQRELVERAVRRISAVPFDSPDDQHTVGRSVAAKVTQYLFNNKAADLRIVERDSIEEILREQEIRSLQGKGTGINLAAADYLLQGSVVEARVESDQISGKKTQRVVTGQRQLANPEYARWLKMSGSQQARTPRPPEQILEAVTEDVTYGVTIHRKVGVLAVAFRVIEATSTKVVFADTVTVKREVSDDSTEGVSLGGFEIPFKIASPPSNIEIMEGLTKESSAEIGARILEAMAQPELALADTAGAAASEGDFGHASDLMGRAYVLADLKGGETGPYRVQLMQYASAAASALR